MKHRNFSLFNPAIMRHIHFQKYAKHTSKGYYYFNIFIFASYFKRESQNILITK